MTDEALHETLESSFRIAWDYLDGTGELGDCQAATQFLLDNIAEAMIRGELRPLLLSNRAITAYRGRQVVRDFALVS